MPGLIQHFRGDPIADSGRVQNVGRTGQNSVIDDQGWRSVASRAHGGCLYMTLTSFDILKCPEVLTFETFASHNESFV